MHHVIAYDHQQKLESDVQALKAIGIEEEKMYVVDRFEIPWSAIALGALVGGALGSVLMYAAEMLIYYQGTMGLSSIYPLLGVGFGMLVGIAIGALAGWLVNISRYGDVWPYRDRLKKGQGLLFIPRGQDSEQIHRFMETSEGSLIA